MLGEVPFYEAREQPLPGRTVTYSPLGVGTKIAGPVLDTPIWRMYSGLPCYAEVVQVHSEEEESVAATDYVEMEDPVEANPTILTIFHPITPAKVDKGNWQLLEIEEESWNVGRESGVTGVG